MSAEVLPSSPPTPPEPPRFDAAALAAAVSAEMEAIFRGMPAPALLRPEPAAAPTVLRAPGVVRAEPAKRGLRPLTAGAIAAAAAIGLVVGALTHAPAPAPISPVGETAGDRAMAALEIPASAPLPPEAPAATPEPPRPAARHTARIKRATLHKAAIRPATRSNHARATIRAQVGCGAELDAADCVQDEIAAADRQLRRNYLEAARAGAPLSTLRGVRQDWQTLRDQATDDPETVILGYRNLADNLANETVAAKAFRGGRMARSRSNSPRDEVDPSWR